MNTDHFHYSPLENVAKGIESNEGMSLADIKAELVGLGYDPDRVTARIAQKARDLSDNARLAWMTDGASNQENFNILSEKKASWRTRSVEVINRAFNEIIQGTRGLPAQQRLQTAFRNFSSLTVEDKATFLDEVELLNHMDKKVPPSKLQ